MRFGGIAAPEHDEVGPVLDLAERAGDFADALKRHAAGAVAHGRRRVDAAADAVGNGHGHALGLAGGVGKAVDNRISCLEENACGFLHRLIERRRFAADCRHGPLLDVVIEEPRLAQNAGVLGPDDAVVLDGQFHVVADTAAEGAGGVGNSF